MGLWKRVSERTKQTLGLKGNEANWKPTSNARNTAMIEEARKFSKQLKALHRELKELGMRIDTGLSTVRTVLNAPLPRVMEMSDKGPVPVEKETGIVGSGVAFDVLTAAGSDVRSKLQAEVLHPLDQWQAAYRMIKHRNSKCEDLRLELDAKRREAAAMNVTLEKQKTRAHAADAKTPPVSEGGAGSPNKFEDAEFKLQKEEDKVTRLTQRFKDVEAEVYNALLTLINDTKVLKQYAATALVVYQNGFAHAYTAFSEALQSLQLTTSQAHMQLGVGGGVGAAPGPGLESTPSKARLSGGGDVGSPASGGASPPTAGLPVSTPPAPPAWYNEARQAATSMKYDSDDDS
ncbi:hypothetical protein HXX76_008880 [Chlamydomonas incerta]|uniref:BAR domain-containing protein n=1 Tax=Chlamydomonas incerta TaxID=51695 RepID=A0A835VYF6_CHLIN|nr:hypothetical protein HXX76_008880 [Chlamydomonas incerta]|eukprot:KAG2432535.1 hypothetical protein HXX76_008880 [Chlamydomonas incerta]